MKVVDAIGAQLDWMVAKCEGDEFVAAPGVNGIGMEYEATRYSTNWAQGGPIIEREGINVGRHEWMGPSMEVISWSAERYATEKPGKQIGPTPLIAAMRAYVTSKLGDEVDVPEELTCSPASKNV